MRKAIESKKMAELAIMIVAKNGFFGKEDISLRLVNSKLKNIHL